MSKNNLKLPLGNLFLIQRTFISLMKIHIWIRMHFLDQNPPLDQISENYRVATKFRYGSYLAKNGSKNGGIKANTTSSSSKFCQLSKNARLFDLGPAAGTEIRVFVSQGGVQNQ